MQDLFSQPLNPAPADTRRDAMNAMSLRSIDIQARAFAHIKSCGSTGSTTDECAFALRLTVLAVRPRFTELKKLGLIVASSERRVNSSGRSAIVWIALAGAGGNERGEARHDADDGCGEHQPKEKCHDQ